MFVRLLSRSAYYIFAVFMLAVVWLLMSSQSLLIVQAARQQITAGNTYVVNSTVDSVDADVGNPVCADIDGHCTLRAAIMQANFDMGPDTITLPSGIYTLTRPGDDDAAVLGDLDVVDDLTIQGAGSGSTIVDGNGSATGDRVFQILATAKNVNLSSLTIRSGQKISNTFDEGGGLFWDGNGSHLHLYDVVFENNRARYAGGLQLNYSGFSDIVELDHVVVRSNVATTGAAGGLGTDFGDLATFDLRDSQIVSNAAYEAGGLYFQGTPPTFDLQSIRLERDEIYSNTASLSGGLENHSGTSAVPIVLVNSRLHDNHAGFYGGAIGNYGTLVISNTTITANSASITGTNAANTRGGGVYDYEGGRITFVQSTLSGNSAASGGGIYSEFFQHNTAALTMTNSTLSNNTASRDGGGLYVQGGQIKLLNATIAGNHIVIPVGTFYAGLGGGVYITGTASVTVQNTLVADNSHRDQILVEPDDCFAMLTPLHSLGNNLIEDVNNCTISGTTAGNITGQDPQLGPLQNNGGSTLTQAPAMNSPAIDHGDDTACPPIDQRGWHRPIGASCDIGAVEVGLPMYLAFIHR